MLLAYPTGWLKRLEQWSKRERVQVFGLILAAASVAIVVVAYTLKP